MYCMCSHIFNLLYQIPYFQEERQDFENNCNLTASVFERLRDFFILKFNYKNLAKSSMNQG